MKKIIIVLFIFAFLSMNVYANVYPEPVVKIGKEIGIGKPSIKPKEYDPNDNTPVLNTEITMLPSDYEKDVIEFQFERMLGKYRLEIEDKYKDKINKFSGNYDIIYKKVKNYNFMIYKKRRIQDNGKKDEFIYILDNLDICVGHCFIDSHYFEDQTNKSEINQIRALPIDNNYLKGKILKNRSFYTILHDNYIERYYLTKNSFYLDSFYPKELENKLSARVRKIENFNFIHNNINSIKDHKDANEDDDYDDDEKEN